MPQALPTGARPANRNARWATLCDHCRRTRLAQRLSRLRVARRGARLDQSHACRVVSLSGSPRSPHPSAWRSARPFKAQAPLVVDADVVLPLAIPFERIQPVAAELEVSMRDGCFQLVKLHRFSARLTNRPIAHVCNLHVRWFTRLQFRKAVGESTVAAADVAGRAGVSPASALNLDKASGRRLDACISA